MRGWNVNVEPSGDKWRCRWRGKYGKGQKVFTYRADALAFKQEKQQDFERQDAGLPQVKRESYTTLGAAADEYLRYSKKEKSARTYRNFDLPAVTSFRQYVGDSVLLLSITPSIVQKWKHQLPETTTASILFRNASAFLNYCVRMKHIDESPAKGLKKPQEGDGGRPLTDAEMVALFSFAEEALYRTGIFARNIPFRIQEVADLDWSHIFSLPDGSWYGVIPWQSRKTRNTNPDRKDCVFPINDEARSVMGQRRESGRVFPYSVTTIQHQMVRARKAAGLPEDITFHCFRHTAASKYMESGGHMEDLLPSGSNVWKDPRSLLRYVKVRPETLASRFQAMKYTPISPKYTPQRKSPRPGPQDKGS